MKFTEAKEKDIPLLQKLARESWTDTYRNILSEAQLEYMLEMMYSEKELKKHLTENPDYHYFLVWENQEALGFIGFEQHYKPATTKLHRIYLLPEAKGKGLGKAAISFLKIQTKNSGDQRIILTVNKNNPARRFYEKAGFKVYDEAVFDIGNSYVMDDYLMDLTLD